jgi:hypothetical protein
MNKSELIYLASPYSKGDMERNFELVTKKAAELVAEGYTVISPITYGHTLLKFKEMPNDWGFWINFCSQLLYKCDRLLLYKIPGWDSSVGVAEELSIAVDHNIPITYLEYEDLDKVEVIITSTPTGQNHFYKEFQNQKDSPRWDL